MSELEKKSIDDKVLENVDGGRYVDGFPAPKVSRPKTVNQADGTSHKWVRTSRDDSDDNAVI